MIIAWFKLRPHPRSPKAIRIRIYDTERAMTDAAHADGSVSGDFKASHCGYEGEHRGRIGDIYLYANPDLRSDAVHELVHAAVHYVREIRGGDLSVPGSGKAATAAEEMLCDTVENYVTNFCAELLRRERRMTRLLANTKNL